jgi:serine protease AprX
MKGRTRFISVLTALLLIVWSTIGLPVRRIQAQSRATGEAIAHNDGESLDLRSRKLPRDLRAVIDDSRGNALSKETRDVIVQIDGTSAADQIESIRQHGGRVRHTFKSVNALLVEMPTSRIEELALEDDVAFISPDRQVSIATDAAARLVGANQVWQSASSTYGSTYSGVTGAGVGIAFIDSGISPGNPDFKDRSNDSRIVAFRDYAGNNHGEIQRDAYDDYGHGTPVAGVAAGSGWASQQRDSRGAQWYPGNYGDFIGIAPGANIISLKALNSEGAGTVSNVIRALDYCFSYKWRYNIKVINLSLSAPVSQSYKTDPLCQAVERCVASGMVVVCSAGNYGHNDVVTGHDAGGNPIYQTVYGGIGSPGNDPKVITVGATRIRSSRCLPGPTAILPQPSTQPPTRFDDPTYRLLLTVRAGQH